ncbi:MAG: 50S ribosomal protein L30 [Mogibacterium sp.]|nr:50S ribosomal protein L30 [Oscillospiraceae bacterium]MBR2806556.1 50S ribosomal protein L30 [Oscillospiraceae bacterium]MBR3125791.1 50S ribosomal protein L30 [Mogibacterium sp.]
MAEKKVVEEAAVEKKTRAKKATAKKTAEKAEEKKLEVTLIKGFSGKMKTQIAVAKSLGLHRIGDVSVQPDNDATRGKIAKISHMLSVKEN